MKAAMEGFIEKNEEAIEGTKERENGERIDTFTDLIEEKGRESSSSSDFLSSETTGLEEQGQSGTEESSSSPPSTMGWPVKEIDAPESKGSHRNDDDDVEKKNLDDKKLEKQVSVLSGMHYALFYNE